jgi:peptide/nickel transport system permease protein
MQGPVMGPPAPDREAVELTDEEVYEIANRAGRLHRFGRELLQDTPLLVGLLLLAGLGVIAVVELLRYGSSVDTLAINLNWAILVTPPGPSWSHPFGIANYLGVDVLTAVLQATPWDLAIVGSILLASVALGVFLGTYTGFTGGPLDYLVSMLCDVFLSIPPFLLVPVLYLGVATPAFIPPQYDLLTFLIVFIVVIWPYYARPVRARAERVSREPYVEAARASGASPRRVLFRHVLPNSLFPVFAQLPVDLYNIFFVLTVFSYLGCQGHTQSGNFGWVQVLPSVFFPEWGNLLGIGACYGWSFLPGSDFWWMYAFPLLMIVLFGMSVMLICDGLERMLHGRAYGS